MLVITKGVQSDIMVTLQDSITLLNPYYLFVFTNVSTKEELKVIVNSADDKSNHPNRINVFEIDNTLFDDLAIYL
jgi:predicted nucleic acid-binding protein